MKERLVQVQVLLRCSLPPRLLLVRLVPETALVRLLLKRELRLGPQPWPLAELLHHLLLPAF